MKKFLVATALLSSLGLAQAQSTATVYGVIDTGVQSANLGAGRLTRMADSQLATSRLGFKGTEDLGNGLKASFQLEGQLNPSAGSMGSTTTVVTNEVFNRDSYVGLGHASLGEVRIGRTDVAKAGEVDATITMPISGNFGLMPVNGTGVELGTDQKNVVSYFSPTIKGFQVIAGHATSANGTTTAATDKQTGATLVYTTGALKLAVGRQMNDGAGLAKRDANTYGASYDLGRAVVGIAHAEGDTSTTADVTSKSTIGTVKVPFGGKYAAHVLYGTTTDGSKTADGKGTGYAVVLTNDLSKRTTLYAAYTSVTNQSQSSMRFFNGTAPVSAGQDTNSFGVGINHSF